MSKGYVLSLAALVGLAATSATAAAQGRDAAVTFTKDVAPILQRSCVQCHRQGAMAPMSLMTYEEARPWARAMKTRVTATPWAGGLAGGATTQTFGKR